MMFRKYCISQKDGTSKTVESHCLKIDSGVAIFFNSYRVDDTGDIVFVLNMDEVKSIQQLKGGEIEQKE